MVEEMTLPQLYARGRENLEKQGYRRFFPPESAVNSSVEANRKYLDSLFFETRFFDPPEVDTSTTLFGTKLKTPVFCSPISGLSQLSSTALADIATGLKEAGSLFMLGIGGTQDIESAVATGVPVVKIIKPYRKTGTIYDQLKDAERLGCVAVGMDIDHFYGALREGGKIAMTDLFAPQKTDEIRKIIASTKLPFIIKGILSLQDAKRALEIGASAIVVSNHGSSSVEFGVPSAVALPKIVEAVGARMTVLIDTGFKTVSDVLKGLALGAKSIGLASSVILAWGAGGAKGVETLVNLITAELRRTMAATGCASVESVKRGIIVEVA